MKTGGSPSQINDQSGVLSVLRRFLEGACTLQELRQLLHDYIIIDFDAGPERREIRFPQTLHVEIPVNKGHVCRMLNRYIAEEVTNSELSDWAAVIFTSPSYVPEGATDEERSQNGDLPLWDILQRLMTPAIFDGLDRQVALRYVEMLDCQH